MAKSEPKEWAVGDPCPNGCGDLVAVPAPSDAQRAAAARNDSNSWVPIPATHDSADPAFIAEHGSLYRCPACGYQSRATAPEPSHAAPAPAPAPAQ